MDLTQVVLGLALLAVGAVAFASPAFLESNVQVSLFAFATLAIGGGAFLVGTVRNGRLE